MSKKKIEPLHLLPNYMNSEGEITEWKIAGTSITFIPPFKYFVDKLNEIIARLNEEEK